MYIYMCVCDMVSSPLNPMKFPSNLGGCPTLFRLHLLGFCTLQALQQPWFQGLAEALGQLVLRPRSKNWWTQKSGPPGLTKGWAFSRLDQE